LRPHTNRKSILPETGRRKRATPPPGPRPGVSVGPGEGPPEKCGTAGRTGPAVRERPGSYFTGVIRCW
jgi:hypothetical protein